MARGEPKGIVSASVKTLHSLSGLILILFLGGCETLPPPKAILGNGTGCAIVTQVGPELKVMNVGTTVFQNKTFRVVPDGLDVGDLVAETVRRRLNKTVAVVAAPNPGGSGTANDDDAISASALTQIGREQGVDRLVVITTGKASDWLYGTNQNLDGLGLYRREVFGMRRFQLYAVLELRVYDCGSAKFIADDTARGAQEVPSIEWHDTWEAFSAGERRRIYAGLKSLVGEQVGVLLTKAGLSDMQLPKESTATGLLIRRPAESWLPEGNALPIPDGISKERAVDAVIQGLTDRGWTLVSRDGDSVIGMYRDGKKEAGVVASVTDSVIELKPNDFEIKADGTRVSVAPYRRWQSNLKESIYRVLLNMADAEAMPAENDQSAVEAPK